MSTANTTNNNKQGFVLSYNAAKNSMFLALLGTVIWPIHVIDQFVRYYKPFPKYRGSARLEGSEGKSLADIFFTRGYQPCVLKLAGVRMKHGDTFKTHLPKEGLYVAAIIRYAGGDLAPSLRIVTQPASEAVTASSGWNRMPIKIQGSTDAERYENVVALLGRPGPNPTLQAEVTEADPFC